ncbi:hypothetical protein [Roseibium sp. MMSF_3544]|uniref:hypothetical protein n=1 Tax=unclassified Roseibium TaxID=2629323 RepID=UPI00273D86B0|nr:hypothetical protein [Roseibium sp. MMSF_3544]
MANLANRLSKLERRMNPAGSQPEYTVFISVGDQSEEEIEEFLNSEGYFYEDDLMVVRFTGYERGPNGPIPAKIPMGFIGGKPERKSG